MQSAPMPPNEKERLQKVVSLGILDTESEERFDAITRDATVEFNVPISTISIIDEKREWYKSCQGLDVKEAPRDVSFCAHAILSGYYSTTLSRDIFIVEDTLKDIRFKDNPMVIGKPYIRFYAGVSLHAKDGTRMGVFCIKDTKPRILNSKEVGRILDYAFRAEKELNKTNK